MSIDAQLVGTRGDSAGATTSVTTGSGTSTATKFVIFTAWFTNNSTDTVTVSVTDSQSNTYTQVGTNQITPNGDIGIAAFLCEAGTAGASHTATATFSVTGSANVYSAAIYLAQVSGALATALDQHAQGNASARPYTLTSPALSVAGELVLALCGCDTGTSAAWSSATMTLIDSDAGNGTDPPLALGKAVQATTGAFTASFTRTSDAGDHPSPLFLLTFKPSGGGVIAQPQIMLLGMGN